MVILWAFLAIVALAVTVGLQKQHRDETGVWGPSRSQMAYIRRKSREKGISEAAAYDQWLTRKQRRGAAGANSYVPPPRARIAPDLPYDVIARRHRGEWTVRIACSRCSSSEIHVDPDVRSPLARATCAGCGRFFGSIREVEIEAQAVADRKKVGRRIRLDPRTPEEQGMA